MEQKKSDSIWMQHNPDEELLLDSVSKFITDLQEENERLRSTLSEAIERVEFILSNYDNNEYFYPRVQGQLRIMAEELTFRKTQ